MSIEAESEPNGGHGKAGGHDSPSGIAHGGFGHGSRGLRVQQAPLRIDPYVLEMISRCRPPDYFASRNHFDLDRNLLGKRHHADGGARASPAVAEYLHHQIRKTIDDLRVLLEVWRCVDHPKNLYDAMHVIEAADNGSNARQHVNPSAARRCITLINGQAAADFADDVGTIGTPRNRS